MKSKTDWGSPGDLIGFCGFSFESHFINVVTYGVPYFGVSHVGVLAEYKNDLLLFESTTLCDQPCFIALAKRCGSQAHRIDSRVQAYRGKVWHYPLRRTLRAWESKALTRYLVDTTGRPYDTIGAFRAGGRAFSWFESKLRPECQAALFCSEWVASAHRYIELFDTDHVGKWSPNGLIREELRRHILAEPRRRK